MSKAIVIGATGQLGQCLQAVAPEKGAAQLVFLSREQADIADAASLRVAFEAHQPDYCINCAAYTAVDKAEDEPEKSLRINRDGVISLSQLCREFGTTLIHISTDFVFSGNDLHPLAETDATSPVNMYGASKMEGELAIPEYLNHYFILRTSWLYSEFGGNFVKTMLKFGRERDELRVIWDQIGTPTYAIDLAKAILRIMETNSQAYGLYHYSNEGLTSWYDFAKAIFDISGVQVRVVPVRTAEYVTKAKRPAYSVMDKSKIKQNLDLAIPYWRDSLKTCLAKMESAESL
ncbi:dTDP-4-dehydrorhamnose reductase [Pontibacter sp. E15-1]|uniref:dTDP-4-dehydrorhamnose reductase n=1 Tax=Pontibacter sp. E15-1 TaxID=2919918 RepID=UPI001F4F9B14|nr:dTDP-4-dehydrorhamnose reductase [Pontibacter sp. E15-1]MCJ8164180.1 dTDP-4-dehydrorhamnose reductase [Pontibacter sp. E15-1]